jgi:hypothetical protein
VVFDARPLHTASANLPRFEFIDLDGETQSLPNVGSMTTAQAERFQSGDLAVLGELGGIDAYKAVQAMSMSASEHLAQAWLAHGGERGKAGS